MKDVASGKVIEYLYDAEGNRLIERDGTDDSTTLYLGTAEVTVKNDTRSTVRTYTLDDVPVATRDKNGIQLVGANHQNTPVITSSATSQALTKRRFSPFGEALNGPSWPSERGFLNKQVDASVGTVHVGAREYDPSDGRFLSVDPIADFKDPQQLNGYAYANNAPVTRSDPSGLFAESPNGNAATAARLRDMVDSNKRSRAGWRVSDNRGFVPRSTPSYPPQWLMDSTTHMRGCFAGNICPTASGGPSILERLAIGVWDSFTFKGTRSSCGNDLTSLSCAGKATFDTASTVATIFGVGLIAKVGKAAISAVRSSRAGGAGAGAGGSERLLWTSWQGYPKVAEGGQTYAKIGDRLYTRHAVDRMQPRGLGAPAGTKGPGRGVSPNFVENVLQNAKGAPTKGPNGESRLSFSSGSVQVITQDEAVITVITR